MKKRFVGTREMRTRRGEALNRVIRVSSTGWENEAGQRHAELLIKTLKHGARQPSLHTGRVGEMDEGHREGSTVDGDRSGRTQGPGGEGKLCGV